LDPLIKSKRAFSAILRQGAPAAIEKPGYFRYIAIGAAVEPPESAKKYTAA